MSFRISLNDVRGIHFRKETGRGIGNRHCESVSEEEALQTNGESVFF